MKHAVLLVLGAALFTSACSRGENPDELFAGNPGGIDSGYGSGPAGTPIAGLAGGPVTAQSLQYFNEVIGDRVYFLVDQSTLTPTAMATLDQQANWMLLYPQAAITIEGHADEQGTREYNIALSARRASAVRNYLVAKGIPDARLSTIPFGKERPVEVCSEERCWSQNRRAVTVVSGGLGA